MGQMFRRMELTQEEIQLARSNTAVLTIRDLQDGAAITEIERHAAVFKPDVICINPLTSFLSGSVYKDEVINKFLRALFTPMLDRQKASGLVVGHPPKPVLDDKTRELTQFELQYGQAGMASLTNAPRSNMFLTHVDGDVFRLAVGKGFDDLGTNETTAVLRRSKDENGVMLWERCESEKAEEAHQNERERKEKKRQSRFVPYERLLKCLKPVQKYSRQQLLPIAKQSLGCGRPWTDDALKQLVFEKKLVRTPEKNPDGQPHVFYHLPTILEPAGNE